MTNSSPITQSLDTVYVVVKLSAQSIYARGGAYDDSDVGRSDQPIRAFLNYRDAEAYADKLNAQRFAGKRLRHLCNDDTAFEGWDLVDGGADILIASLEAIIGYPLLDKDKPVSVSGTHTRRVILPAGVSFEQAAQLINQLALHGNLVSIGEGEATFEWSAIEPPDAEENPMDVIVWNERWRDIQIPPDLPLEKLKQVVRLFQPHLVGYVVAEVPLEK
jgi:hypothetical protein